MHEIQVGSQTLSVSRPHLKKWLELEQIKSREKADKVEVVCKYLSAFLDWSDEQLDKIGWIDVISLYTRCLEINSIQLKLAFLEIREKKTKAEVWEYPEQLWYSFAHMLAQEYGWTLDVIAELDVDDAMALIQEILLDEQFQREWQWSLTELAYPYDKGSKKSTFHPLERPTWMRIQAGKVKLKTVRTPANMMPIGNVIGMPDETVEPPQDARII